MYILKPAFFFVHNKHNLFFFKSNFLRVSDCQIRQFFGSELTKFCLRLAPPKKKDTHILLLSYFDSSHSNFPTSDFVLKTPKKTHTHTHIMGIPFSLPICLLPPPTSVADENFLSPPISLQNHSPFPPPTQPLPFMLQQQVHLEIC